MSVFSKIEYNQIKAAYMAFLSGKSVYSVSTSDGRTVTFQRTDIDSLRKALFDAKADISTSTKGGRLIGFRTSKGL